MSKKSVGTFTLTLLAAASIVFAPGAAVAWAQGNDTSPAEAVKAEGLDYEALSSDLQALSGLWSGGSGKAVVFDRDGAAERAVAPHSLQLAEEMAAFTNELMAGPAEPGRNIVDVGRGRLDARRYPMLAHYFEVAGYHHRHHPADDTLDEPAPDAAVQPASWITEYTCGATWRPRPGSAAPRRSWYSSNPAATLSGWGYHSTPNLGFGGGWTRPHSYSWALCGFDTYRDHANIILPTTILEQLYVGYTPPGEPNPEIYRSGPWPYATWPAYVYWWHEAGPGR